MEERLISIPQALQLIGLYPCLFVIFFLFLAAAEIRKAWVPAGYFFILAVQFFLPLTPLFELSERSLEYGMLLFIESLAPAFCFLLIVQFLRGDVPPLPYWLVLSVPMVGGSSLVYGTIMLDELCVAPAHCLDMMSAKTLYTIFGASLIFLLLVVLRQRSQLTLEEDDPHAKHKYWLVMALIMLSIQLLIVDLAVLAEWISEPKADMIRTLTRLVFIALIATSLFRVFDRGYRLDYRKVPMVAPERSKVPAKEKHIAQQITALLEKEPLHREMGLTRQQFAEKMGVAEHMLSRVMNVHLGKNFNELINSYRVKEAKVRLHREPDTSITVIAFEVGFNSIASFNRVFKELVGMSPSEYRASELSPEN